MRFVMQLQIAIARQSRTHFKV